MVGHAPVFQKALAEVYNSMVSAELPLHLHVRYLIERLDRAVVSERRNYAAVIPGTINITDHGQMVAYDKQFHSSLHNNSCVTKGLPYCRYVPEIILHVLIVQINFKLLWAGIARGLSCAHTQEVGLLFLLITALTKYHVTVLKPHQFPSHVQLLINLFILLLCPT
jgi:hypothetical protein